jgi:hypothetical protein
MDGSCKAYGAGGVMWLPTRLRILVGRRPRLKVETGRGQQTRLLGFDASRAPGARSLQGFSVAAWEPVGGQAYSRTARAPARPTPDGTLKVVDHELERRMAAPQRRALQREHHHHRVLGSRGVSERRRLLAVTIVLSESEVPHGRVHEKRALQARGGRVEVAAVPPASRAEDRAMRSLRLSVLLAALAAAVVSVPMRARARRSPSWSTSPAPWQMANDEELLIRVDPVPSSRTTPASALNAAGRQKALTWNSTIQAVPSTRRVPTRCSTRCAGPGPNFHMGEVIDPNRGQLVAYTITGLFENANRTSGWTGVRTRRSSPSTCGAASRPACGRRGC